MSLCAFPQFLGHIKELFYEMECEPSDYSWLGMGPKDKGKQRKKTGVLKMVSEGLLELFWGPLEALPC